jgi:hypothetical protein
MRKLRGTSVLGVAFAMIAGCGQGTPTSGEASRVGAGENAGASGGGSTGTAGTGGSGGGDTVTLPDVGPGRC